MFHEALSNILKRTYKLQKTAECPYIFVMTGEEGSVPVELKKFRPLKFNADESFKDEFTCRELEKTGHIMLLNIEYDFCGIPGCKENIRMEDVDPFGCFAPGLAVNYFSGFFRKILTGS